MDNEPKIEDSPLSQFISRDGKTVNVQIYRLEGEKLWFLEVVDEFNNSTVWDDPFETDSAALAEVNNVITSEGITSLIGI